MKTCNHGRRSGITRAEVLVLLAVLSVLFMLLYPAINTPNQASLKAKAGTAVKNIVNACKAYAADYGHFPKIQAAQDGVPGSPPNTYLSFGDGAEGGCKVDNGQLFNVLRAIPEGPNVGDVLNPLKRRYFENNKATDKGHPRGGFADGPDFPANLRGRLYDPWGAEYCIILDTDGDETLNLGAFFQDLADPEFSIRSSAAAFSMSKDGKRGGKGHPGMYRKPNSDDAPDDVASWN